MGYIKIYFYFIAFYTGTTFEIKIFFPLLSIGCFLSKNAYFLQPIEIITN